MKNERNEDDRIHVRCSIVSIDMAMTGSHVGPAEIKPITSGAQYDIDEVRSIACTSDLRIQLIYSASVERLRKECAYGMLLWSSTLLSSHP